MAKENMIFAGLWFGDKKPAMATFLKPLYENLLLMDKGITVECSERDKFLCRAVLLAGSCDLPARCLVCNSLQFNGDMAVGNAFNKEEQKKLVFEVTQKYFRM